MTFTHIVLLLNATVGNETSTTVHNNRYIIIYSIICYAHWQNSKGKNENFFLNIYKIINLRYSLWNNDYYLKMLSRSVQRLRSS